MAGNEAQEALAKYNSPLGEALVKLKGLVRESGPESWSDVSSTDAAKVKRTYVKGHSAPCFKAVGVLPACPHDILNKILLDNARRTEWNPSYGGTTVVLHTGTFKLYVERQNGALGGRISARDFAEVQTWVEEEGVGIWFCYISVEDPRCPPCPSFTRGTIYPSGFLLETIPDKPGHTRVHYVVHSELAGSIPYFVVSMAIPPEMQRFYTKVPELLS
ncbi:START domain [Pelomyxa schiedti]|nr:START domain [Pelomyxa schiedti]